jgi:hypothetical protein
MSCEEVFLFAYTRTYIPTMKILADEVGLDVLQRAAHKAAGKAVRERPLPRRDLATFAGFFKNPDPRLANMLTLDVIEDTDTVFEIRVTECLWAKTFRDADAAEIGRRCICGTDYVTAEAFNDKLRLIRDKTLMEGHPYCNHRYVMGA